MPENVKPDWIASALSGKLKDTGSLALMNVKAKDFDFRTADEYWATPKIQEAFQEKRDEFNKFYETEKVRFDKTNKSDYELDFNVEASMDKWSVKPLISYSVKAPIEDPWGRQRFGDFYSPKQYGIREKAISNGVRVDDNKYVPIDQYKGDIRLAKNADSSYKLDEKGNPYWEPLRENDEMRSFDESYSSFAHNMGIYGVNRNYLKEGFYTVAKSVPDFISRTADSLLELPRQIDNAFGGDTVSKWQSDLRQQGHPVSESSQEGGFFDSMSLLNLGLDSVYQLLSMGGVAKVARVLGASAQTSSVAARTYMTGMAAGPIAQISREAGLTPSETALLFGANAAAIYRISRLSDMIINGVRPLEFTSKASQEISKAYGVTIAQKGFNQSSLKSFQTQVTDKLGGLIAATQGAPVARGAFLEGVEEVAEQTVDSGLRGLHNILSPIMNLEGKFNWDLGNEMQSLMQAGIGGAFGGAIAHPLMKRMGMHERDNVDTFEGAVANNDESFVHNMINQWENAGRLGANLEENQRNATGLREVLNTMTTIRDTSGLKNAIENNQKAAGKFAEILKQSSIGRDKILLGNEINVIKNQILAAEKANSPAEVERLNGQLAAKEKERNAFNSGAQVERYVTEGLYNVESSPEFRGDQALHSSDHFNGKLFTEMNIDSKAHFPKLREVADKRNAKLIENDATATIDTFKDVDITEAGHARIMGELTTARDELLNNISQNADAINSVLKYSTVDILTDPKNSGDIEEEFSMKSPEEMTAIQSQPWFKDLQQLINLDKQIAEVGSKRVSSPVDQVPDDEVYFYDFENGQSTVPFSERLNRQLREAGEGASSKEERQRMSSLYISDEPARLRQVVTDRINQVLGINRLNQLGGEKVILPDLKNPEQVLTELLTLRATFDALDNLSNENKSNTDARITQVYLNALSKRFNNLHLITNTLAGTRPELVDMIHNYDADLQESLDNGDSVAFRTTLLNMESALFTEFGAIRTDVLKELKTKFKALEKGSQEDEHSQKLAYDYLRRVLSVDSAAVHNGLFNFVNNIPNGSLTPTREHQDVSMAAIANAMAGDYDWGVLPEGDSRQPINLSFSALVDGGAGSGKTKSVIPTIASVMNSTTGGKVIITAFQDKGSRKIQRVRADVENFFKGKPEYVSYADQKLIDILSDPSVDEATAIIYDEAGLVNKDELVAIQTKLNVINTRRLKEGRVPLHMFYTLDSFQNGHRDPRVVTTHSITNEAVSSPSSSRLTYSFRSVNAPLKSLEDLFRQSQLSRGLPSNRIFEYDDDFNGVLIVKDKAQLDEMVRKLAGKLKAENKLSNLAYINVNESSVGSPVIGEFGITPTTSIESQGDEWDYVVVDSQSGNAFTSKPDKAEYYTAVTRAKKGAIVYVNSEAPLESVKGTVRTFTPVTPPAIAKAEMLEELNTILGDKKADPAYNVKNVKTPVKQTEPPRSIPTPPKPPISQQEGEDLDIDLEKEAYQTTIESLVNQQGTVLFNTFYDVEGEVADKKRMMFDDKAIAKTRYMVTVARIGAPGYQIVESKRSPAFERTRQYGVFIEGVSEDGGRAVLGVVSKGNMNKVLTDAGIITKNEIRDIVLHQPISSEVVRQAKYFHPFIDNEQLGRLQPNGEYEKIDKSTKHSLSDINTEASGINVAVTPLLIAEKEIRGKHGDRHIEAGEPFVLLSYRHSPADLKRLASEGKINPEHSDVMALGLSKERFKVPDVINILKPYFKRTPEGFLGLPGSSDPQYAEATNIYNSFWYNESGSKKTYLQVFNDVAKNLRDDPDVSLFLKNQETIHKGGKKVVNGKTKSLEPGYNPKWLLEDYIAIQLETSEDVKSRSAMRAKEKIFNAMMNHPKFSNLLTFSPSVQYKKTGRDFPYFLSQDIPQSILDKGISASYWRITPPKLQIPPGTLTSQMKPQKPLTQPEVPAVSGSTEEVNNVQGERRIVRPLNLVDFKNKEFPSKPRLALDAVQQFRRDVVNYHLNLTVPVGQKPNIRNIDEAMKELRSRYMSATNMKAARASKQSQVEFALGRNFESLLANYYPAISYNSSSDVFSLNNEVFKTATFTEQEEQNLLTNGITSIVKTYLNAIKLPDGTYFNKRHIINLVPLFRGTDFASRADLNIQAPRTREEVTNALRTSKLPEAKAIYDMFFSTTPITVKNAVTYSTSLIDSEIAQGLTDAMMQFFIKAEQYVPGFTEIDRKRGYDLETGKSFIKSDSRKSRIPTGIFRPSPLKGRFIDDLNDLLSDAKISTNAAGGSLNNVYTRIKPNPSAVDAVNMIHQMGLRGFRVEMMEEWMNANPRAAGLVQDYFMGTLKKAKTEGAKMTPGIEEMLDFYMQKTGLGNDISYLDADGNRQYSLRDSSPIFHLHTYASQIRSTSSILNNNLLVQGDEYSYSLSNAPFNNVGMRMNDRGRPRSKSLAKMSTDELLEVYLLDTFLEPIVSGKNTVAFPVTVYSDSGTEIMPMFRSDKWMDSPAKTLDKLFNSRTAYYIGLERQVLQPYQRLGLQVETIAELAAAVRSLTPEQANQVRTMNDAVAGLHYDERLMNQAGLIEIKPQLIQDIQYYSNPLNNKDFTDRVRADVKEVLAFSKQETSSPTTLYAKIKQMTSKFSPEEVISAYYTNWLLVSSEFQKMMNGPEYQYKKSGADSFIDMVKRSRSLTSPASFFILRNDSWREQVRTFREANPGEALPFILRYEGYKLNRNPKVFVVTDVKEPVQNLSNGTISNQDVFDGATFVTPFTRIKQNYSTAKEYGPFVGPVMKNITHSFNPNTATKSFIKNAEFEITPEILRNGDQWIIDKFERMVSTPFEFGPIVYEGENINSALELLIALGVDAEYTNVTRDHFDQAIQIIVENGEQDSMVDEMIFQSSMKTGQNTVNNVDAPVYVPTNIDITLKGIQQDAMKDPTTGLDTKVLTQLVNAIAINWTDDTALKSFYNTLAEISKNYLDGMSEVSQEERAATFVSLMRDNLLRTDGVNYRADAASLNRISLNDRNMSSKFSEVVATEIKNAAVAFSLRGGHYVVHPATFLPIYDVKELATGTSFVALRSQLPSLGEGYEIGGPRRLKWEDAARVSDGKTLSQLYQEAGGDPIAIASIHQSLKTEEWVKGKAEIILPAEMRKEFLLDEAVSANLPIAMINEDYFYNQILSKKEKEEGKVVIKKRRQAEIMYDSFHKRLTGIIGRIPTSGKHSAVSVNIVGFMNDSMNSVFVPPELLTVQGADQDIDKGSYLTYKSIVRYNMVDPNVKKGETIRTYNPDSPKYRHLQVQSQTSTGIIPTLENIEAVRELLPKMNNTEFDHIRRVALENQIVEDIKTILDNPNTIVEANTNTNDVMAPLRVERDAILASTSAQDALSYDKLMSLLKIHEMNQAGGKNLTGIFANGSKAYNVMYTMHKMTGTTGLAGLEGNNKIWEMYAGFIGSTVDNGNENILGPMGIDNTVAPYVSYLVSTGASLEEIKTTIEQNAPFFKEIRDAQRYDRKASFDISGKPQVLKDLFYRTAEWNILSRSLVNRDIPTRMDEIMSYITTFENFVNLSYRDASTDIDFDLERFTNSDETAYRDEQVAKYQTLVDTSTEHENNILRVFRDVPHMAQYQRAVMMSHEQLKSVKAYDIVHQLQKSNVGDLTSKNRSFYFYDTRTFNSDYDFVHGLFIDAFLNSRNTKSITSSNIQTFDGRKQFITKMHTLLTRFQGQYPNNLFMQDLMLSKNQDGDPVIRLNDYYDMNDDLRALYMQQLQEITPLDRKRLFLYNLITSRDKNNKGSLTSFFSLDDKASYLNFLDYELNPEIDDVLRIYNGKNDNKNVDQMAIPYSLPHRALQPVVVQDQVYKNARVHVVENIKNASLDISPVSISYIDGAPVIQVDEFAVSRAYENKVWTKPKATMKGRKPLALPDNAFDNREQFRDFLIEFEYLSVETGETDKNVLMKQAFLSVGKQDVPKYKTAEKHIDDAKNCGLNISI